jgi:repressor LexA
MKPTKMLTASQHKTLQIIRDYVGAHGFAPTISEILMSQNVKSRSFIQRNIQALEEAGLLRLIANRRRNIELMDEHQNSRNALGALPLVGRIAAGQPIEAISNPEIVNLSELLLGPDRYLLEVKGDSMIGDNICDGDLVICAYSDIVHSGEIAVVLLDNENATLKRVFYDKQNKTVALIPSNPVLKPMEYPAEKVKIQGIYLGLLRFKRSVS